MVQLVMARQQEADSAIAKSSLNLLLKPALKMKDLAKRKGR